MKFIPLKNTELKTKIDTLLFFAFEDAKTPAGTWKKIDNTLDKKFKEATENEKFKAEERDVILYYPKDDSPARMLIFAGLGKKRYFDLEKLRKALAYSYEKIKNTKCDTLGILLPTNLKLSDLAQSAVEGLTLASYEFKRYKSDKDKEPCKIKDVIFILQTENEKSKADQGIKKGELYSKATFLARDLVNEPASVATPRRLAEIATDIAKNTRIKIKIFDEKEIRKMGMGGLSAVSVGSEEPPRFVHLEYSTPKAKKTIAIIGKGITFDSGGLCIKTQDMMQGMKGDMSGAASVLGIFSVIEELAPNVNIHGIFPATENMPSGKSYKVGDVLKFLNNKTAEIISTDAEGRLILADALAYASNLKPTMLIDIATLTGAIVVALGSDMSGLFSNNQTLVEKLLSASKFTGEKLWHMPIETEYRELLKSDIADMKNSGGRNGGAILGALFLKEFVDAEIPWAHIDIAGPCIIEKGKDYRPAGGTGVMVRTILKFIENLA
jgi:leucyl aminopeptidase